jgi:hypothetical protein
MKNKVFLILAIALLAFTTRTFAADTLSFAGWEWMPVDDVWQVSNSGLSNAGMDSANTNIYARLDQKGSSLTYTWTIKFGSTTSATSGPMAGMHILAVDPLDAARGSSLLIWQDKNRMCLYETVNGAMPTAYRYDIMDIKVEPDEIHTYKAVVNVTSASVDIYRDDVLLHTWKPQNPLPGGNYVSFRTNRTIGTLQAFSFSSK